MLETVYLKRFYLKRFKWGLFDKYFIICVNTLKKTMF